MKKKILIRILLIVLLFILNSCAEMTSYRYHNFGYQDGSAISMGQR